MSKHWRAALFAALTLLLVCAWLPWSQDAAREQSEQGLKRALATYAAARAINALISVAQSTQVSMQPGGVGVATHPGEVLDPLNDLIEQFASLMLAASIAFGVQLLLAEIGAHFVVSLALSLAILACGAVVIRSGRSPRWLTKALIILFLVRFAMPISVVASEMTHRVFFQDQYEASVGALAGAGSGKSKRQGTAAAEAEQQARWSDWIPWSRKIPDESRPPAEATESVVSRMQAFFEDGVHHVVKLAALFIVQTLVLPLLVLWLLVATLRSVALRPFRSAGSTEKSSSL